MKTLIFGDLSPTVDTNPLFKQKHIDKLFNDTVSLFKGNDINFVNLECALTNSENSIKKFGPPLKACKEVADVLLELGVNVIGLSNNHIFDYGKAGAEDTIKTLESLNFLHTGFGMNYEDSRKNLVIESETEKICFICVCEHEYSYALDNRMGSRPYDEYETMSDIREAKRKCDRVIVIYHGGKEHCRYPSPRLRKLCRAMGDNGADIVVCQHSHCIGCYENYNDCHIVYGQGNFHFVLSSQKVPDTWNGSIAVKYDTVLNMVEFVPIVNTDCGIELAKGETKKQIISDFEKRNLSLENGEWLDGWREFCYKSKDMYYKAAKSVSDLEFGEIGESLFAHYLDCEAHTDVWKELFKTANHRNEV